MRRAGTGSSGLTTRRRFTVSANSERNGTMNSTNKIVANAIGDFNFDMKGIYAAAKRMIAAGATHKSGYRWSIPKTYATGAGVVASRVGGAVKVVRDDPDRSGFVIAEITDPLAQALERKGVMNAKAQTARNSVEVEISPGYAARIQHAMRDAARALSGVRMTSSNTLECRDEDTADEVIDILKQAGLPASEVWTNARRTARNARTDWEQEIYALTERIKKLVQKSQRENGDDYPTTVFKDALKAMRGY